MRVTDRYRFACGMMEENANGHLYMEHNAYQVRGFLACGKHIRSAHTILKEARKALKDLLKDGTYER